MRARAERLAVAESCTGGLVSHMLTNTPGSSDYFYGGVVAYANDAKRRVLGVKQATLEEFGAVSEETVREMARGVRAALGVEIGLSISGVAGPGGGTALKPVGLVYTGLSGSDGERARRWQFEGGRLEIKEAAAGEALRFLLDYLAGRR